ncbi:GntR family transcriptional regulator [Paenirhodobacter enshiensis]|uniref:GntR family transcriptional regulator n=1 Tax=Paenirhodobacter enshiensis TaxID=1105367 RepID=UPI0005667791|nr:GntR family transcriptional regulator [Paenirhodobacter enshiensis]
MRSGKKYADDVYSALLSGILEGRYHPGDLLNEIPIAEEYGMSRTPVREALQRLVSTGLAERGPRRALLVRKIPTQTLHALFEAMGEIEGLVARFAALRMSELERQALAAAVQAGDDPDADFEEVNRRFHRIIRDGAHNPVMAEMIEELELRTMPWRHIQFNRRADRIATSQVEHRALAAAIHAEDANEAQRLMRAHTAATFRVVLEIVEGEETPPLR